LRRFRRRGASPTTSQTSCPAKGSQTALQPLVVAGSPGMNGPYGPACSWERRRLLPDPLMRRRSVWCAT
jgi:hypothetical protein